VLGNPGVGKSASVVQYVQGIFVEKYDPTIEDSYRKAVEIDGNNYVVEILDTASNSSFSAMLDLYIKNGHGFIVIYSIVDRDSFNAVSNLVEQIIRVKDLNPSHVPILIAGNKSDLSENRIVKFQEGADLAKKLGTGFIEYSAKTKKNMDQVFYHVIRGTIKKNNNEPWVLGKLSIPDDTSTDTGSSSIEMKPRPKIEKTVLNSLLEKKKATRLTSASSSCTSSEDSVDIKKPAIKMDGPKNTPVIKDAKKDVPKNTPVIKDVKKDVPKNPPIKTTSAKKKRIIVHWKWNFYWNH